MCARGPSSASLVTASGHSPRISRYVSHHRTIRASFNIAALQLKPEELKVIANIVSGDQGAKDKAYGDGVFACGERYVMTKAEDRSMYARKVRINFLRSDVEAEAHVPTGP